MQGKAHNLHSDGALGQQARALTDTNGGIQVGFRLGLPQVRVMINNIFLIRQATRQCEGTHIMSPIGSVSNAKQGGCTWTDAALARPDMGCQT